VTTPGPRSSFSHAESAPQPANFEGIGKETALAVKWRWHASNRRDTHHGMPRRSEAELTETGRLFRAKLRQLREQERPRARRAKRRSPAHRRRIDLASVESPPGDDDVLGPLEMGQLFGVHPKTVTRWATDEGLPSFRTIGGHRRFRWRDVSVWLTRPGPG
jgi:excisionase family DNA binding protein